MNLIEGAAYLSPVQKKVFIACEGWLLYRSDFGDESFLTDPEFFPSDLLLLYAPGDEVLQLEREWIHPTRMLRREGVVTEIYRSHDE